MKAIKNSTPLHILLNSEFDIELDRFLRLNVGLNRNDWDYIGSFAKKESATDVDIAVKEEVINLTSAKKRLLEAGCEVKVYSGFNELSFGFEFDRLIIQIDLMFSKNLEWTKFIYYSPNLLRGESKYKGIYRNLLLSSIIITESRVVIDENNCNQMILRLNEGLFRVHKTFIDESGRKTNISRIIQEEFLTDNPVDFCQILELNGPCLTFEQIWKQMPNRPKFNEIKERFEKFCRQSKIEIPTESLNYGNDKTND